MAIWYWLQLLRMVRSLLSCSLRFHSFSPKESKDPVQDAICIKNERIVIVEGIYLGMDELPWSDGLSLFDEIWLIEVDQSTARKRIIERHVKTGVTADLESAAERGTLS